MQRLHAISLALIITFLFAGISNVQAKTVHISLDSGSYAPEETSFLRPLLTEAFFNEADLQGIEQSDADFQAKCELISVGSNVLLTIRLRKTADNTIVSMRSTGKPLPLNDLYPEPLKEVVRLIATDLGTKQQQRPQSKPVQTQVDVNGSEETPDIYRGGLILHAGWGYGSYYMDDLNNELAEWRSIGINLDDINGGPMFRGGVRLTPQTEAQFGFVYTQLSGKSDYSDATGSLSYDVKSNLFELEALARLGHTKNDPIFIGIAVGMISLEGHFSVNVPSEIQGGTDITGKKLCFRPFIEAQIPLDSNFFLALQAGYRVAEITDVHVADITLEDYSLDYSGLYITGMIMFYIN